MSSKDYETLGQGAYGTIFSPPLPNTDYTPTSNNVLKIYNAQKTYNSAVKIDKNIDEKFPLLEIKTKTYKKPYTFVELPKNIQHTLKTRRVNQNKKKSPYKINIRDNAPVYMVRMPNLGNSIEDLYVDEESYIGKLKKIDCFKLVKEIHKCLEIISDFKNKEYIHCDIEPRNVMFDFKDNTMHIIDFDTLVKKDNYSLHIESKRNIYDRFLFPIDTAIMFTQFDMTKTIKQNINDIIRKAAKSRNKLYDIINDLLDNTHYRGYKNIYTYTEDQLSSIITYIENLVNNKLIQSGITIDDKPYSIVIINIIKHAVFMRKYMYMDLWGFGTSILALCALILRYQPKDPHIHFLINELIRCILQYNNDGTNNAIMTVKWKCKKYIDEHIDEHIKKQQSIKGSNTDPQLPPSPPGWIPPSGQASSHQSTTANVQTEQTQQTNKNKNKQTNKNNNELNKTFKGAIYDFTKKYTELFNLTKIKNGSFPINFRNYHNVNIYEEYVKNINEYLNALNIYIMNINILKEAKNKIEGYRTKLNTYTFKSGNITLNPIFKKTKDGMASINGEMVRILKSLINILDSKIALLEQQPQLQKQPPPQKQSKLKNFFKRFTFKSSKNPPNSQKPLVKPSKPFKNYFTFKNPLKKSKVPNVTPSNTVKKPSKSIKKYFTFKNPFKKSKAPNVKPLNTSNVKPLNASNVKPLNPSNNFSNNVVINENDFRGIKNNYDDTMKPLSQSTKNYITGIINKFNNLCTAIRHLPNSTTIDTRITFNDEIYNINELNKYLDDVILSIIFYIENEYMTDRNDYIMKKYNIASDSLAKILNTNRTPI